MSKRELKNNKSERKVINKRSGKSSNFRSLNNFPTIDKIPNDNLYKNDNIYSIYKNFEFPQNIEDNFRLFFHYHYQIGIMKKIIIFFYLRFFFSKIFYFYDIFSFRNIFNLKNAFHMISSIISYILSNDLYLNKSSFNLIIFYLFFINQCIHIYSIYYKYNLKYEHNLSITSELLFNFFFMFFCNAQIKHAVLPHIIIIIIYYFSIKTFFGLSLLFILLIGPIFSFLIFILLKKSIREIWALFDSFKKSYYNINQGIIESDPNPIFIISKDKNILYRNSVASKLINNILENQNSPKKMNRTKDDKFSNMNFLDIIHPNLKELFKKLLNDVLEDEQVSTFNFPLCKINSQQNLNSDISNAYDIFDEKNYLYFVWFKITICKTEWKTKAAYFMSFFPSEDILLNEIFYQYTKRFSEKIENVISNSDIICNALMNRNEKKEKEKEKENDSPSSSLKSDNNLNLYSPKEDGDIEVRKKRAMSLKKNIYQLLRDNADNIDLNNTILFFFKNQVELLYDYSLTIELYFNMIYRQRNFKFCSNNLGQNSKKKIKLKDLKAYYSEYFYDFTKEHKYKLEFKDNDEKNIFNIFVEENYLRIILFNVIIFMVCYLDDKTEPTQDNRKEILIRIIPELKDESSATPENDEQEDKTPKGFSDSDKSVKKGEVSFIFESFSTKKDLNKIQELINQKNKFASFLKSEIIKLNYLDIGILTVKYLLQNYYKTKLELSNKEGEQVIQFKLPCDLEILTGSNNSRYNQNQNQVNFTPESNSFFTSPIITARNNINKPKNFYNYNQSYNKKVLNIFYGIEKSPILAPRHKRGMPSFSKYNEIDNKNRRCSRHLSQNLNLYVNNNIYEDSENKINIYYEDKRENENSINSSKNSNKNSKKCINQFSFKQINFENDSPQGSFKSYRIENENISNDEEGRINLEIYEEKEEESEEQENEKREKKLLNQVLIIETQNNKDLISFLNNENKGEYIIKIVNNVSEVEKEIQNNEGKCNYKVLLINMGDIKEIKFAENICENKGEILIYGYHFGIHTKLREKNNVKFDKRFDLSFSYEGIVYALKQIFINNKSIIN